MFACISPKHYTSMLESTIDGFVHILADVSWCLSYKWSAFVPITISFYRCEVSQLFMDCAILFGQVKLLNLATNCCHYYV